MNDGRKAGDSAAQAAATTIRLPPIGFWSYSRQDDELSKARLSNLRSLLMAEIQQQYGRDRVQLFQDVSAIPHGAEWEREIRTSLGNSTFFIPIVTPNFLQSEWCCREVMIFFEREEQLFEIYPDLTRRRRIFPLQLIDITGIEPADERVLEGLEKLQWFDFRELRHSSQDHESVHRALSKFAASIRDVLQVKVRSPRMAAEIEREAAAAARAREEETAIVLRRAQEEAQSRREAEKAEAEARRGEAARAAEALRAAEAERGARAARIEARGAAETERSANADADWAAWSAEEESAGAAGERSLLGRWRDAPASHRIAFGVIMLSILVIVVVLSLGGREERNPAPEVSNEPAPAMEGAGPSTQSAPFPTEAAPASRPFPQAEPAPPRPAPPLEAVVRAELVGGSTFTAADYPAAALLAGSEGTTRVRIRIGATGRVTGCSVVSSSGTPSLDEASCRIIRTRFRYSPARDPTGFPTGDTVVTRISWRLPAD